MAAPRMNHNPSLRHPKRPTHFVRCYRLPGGDCCTSCHDDANMGYDNLYWNNTEVAPGISVGVYSCCARGDAVDTRVQKLVKRLGGSGREW